jgi:hypothetical protein
LAAGALIGQQTWRRPLRGDYGVFLFQLGGAKLLPDAWGLASLFSTPLVTDSSRRLAADLLAWSLAGTVYYTAGQQQPAQQQQQQQQQQHGASEQQGSMPWLQQLLAARPELSASPGTAELAVALANGFPELYMFVCIFIYSINQSQQLLESLFSRLKTQTDASCNIDTKVAFLTAQLHINMLTAEGAAPIQAAEQKAASAAVAAKHKHNRTQADPFGLLKARRQREDPVQHLGEAAAAVNPVAALQEAGGLALLLKVHELRAYVAKVLQVFYVGKFREDLERLVSNSISDSEVFPAPQAARLGHLKKPQLVQMCVQAGIDNSGTVEQLVQRLSSTANLPRSAPAPAMEAEDADELQNTYVAIQLAAVEAAAAETPGTAAAEDEHASAAAAAAAAAVATAGGAGTAAGAYSVSGDDDDESAVFITDALGQSLVELLLDSEVAVGNADDMVLGSSMTAAQPAAALGSSMPQQLQQWQQQQLLDDGLDGRAWDYGFLADDGTDWQQQQQQQWHQQQQLLGDDGADGLEGLGYSSPLQQQQQQQQQHQQSPGDFQAMLMQEAGIEISPVKDAADGARDDSAAYELVASRRDALQAANSGKYRMLMMRTNSAVSAEQVFGLLAVPHGKRPTQSNCVVWYDVGQGDVQ